MQEQLNSSHQFIACGRQLQDRRSSNRPNPSTDEGLKCPRCDSPNTKFCYYNNYSLAQPRHFCKNCKRYWTKGGALRNVPVGGGCRKNKRAKQRPAGDHDHDHHRHQHHHPPHSLGTLAEDQSVLLSSIHCEEPAIASSSTSLDFSLGGHDLFVSCAAENELHHQRLGDGVGLTFEKLDHGSRSFSCTASPLSINWAPGQVNSSAATLSSQPFRSSILGFNTSGAHQPKQEPANLYNYNCDLSSIFDPQLNLIGQTSPQISENLRSYHQIYNNFDSFGMDSSGGSDIQWRLPTPTLAMMMDQGGNAGFSDGRLQDRHSTLEKLQPENLRSNTRKSILEDIQASSCVVDNIQGADRLPVWQSHPEGFFDANTADGAAAAYWSNNSWPQHHEMYEDDQLT